MPVGHVKQGLTRFLKIEGKFEILTSTGKLTLKNKSIFYEEVNTNKQVSSVEKSSHECAQDHNKKWWRSYKSWCCGRQLLNFQLYGFSSFTFISLCT